METIQTPKPKKRYLALIPAVIAVIVICAGIYTFISQPKAVNPMHVYEYITSNFNDTLSNASYTPQILMVNSTWVFPNFTVLTFPTDNKTYVYSFSTYQNSLSGAESAAESYVLWAYFVNGCSSSTCKVNPFPSYDQNFPLVGGSIPGIPVQYVISNVSSSNPVLIASQVPPANSTTIDITTAWLIDNLNNEQKYLFTRTGYFPWVYVVRTIANKTMICSGYSGITFEQYNATTSTSIFLGQNLHNQTFGSFLPTPSSMNADLNTLNACVKIVERWNGT